MSHTRDWLISTEALLRHETEPDEPVEDDEVSEVFGYAVNDAAMATRAANAWHDAIVQCGAKSCPQESVLAVALAPRTAALAGV